MKTVKNDQTTHVFTYKCSKLYFEPFQALLLVTYPIIHPQDLKSKHFPFQGLLQQKSFYFRSYDKIDHPQHNTTSLLMLRNTLLHPISHESELLLLFLLEVSAFSLPSPFVHRHSPSPEFRTLVVPLNVKWVSYGLSGVWCKVSHGVSYAHVVSHGISQALSQVCKVTLCVQNSKVAPLTTTRGTRAAKKGCL